MGFPVNRMRRLRQTEAIRGMVRETRLSIKDLIYPIFVVHGSNKQNEIGSMPGIFQYSVDGLPEEIKTIKQLGIPAILLFGIPESKDFCGSTSYDPQGVVQNAIKLVKDIYPELVVITDVCLCEYTDHGHCGVLDQNGWVDNDATLDLLAKEALSHAQAGCDMIAPSDMMDGRIGYIRDKLDQSGFKNLPIMSYAAKYCSAFYGPFREAAESAPQFGDRKTYQMDPGNRLEALREAALDIEEGADIIMVKPALAYLDVIKEVKERFGMPTAAYSVSGEYAMIKAAGANGWLDESKVLLETAIAIKRAGADLIITYAAKELAVCLEV